MLDITNKKNRYSFYVNGDINDGDYIDKVTDINIKDKNIYEHYYIEFGNFIYNIMKSKRKIDLDEIDLNDIDDKFISKYSHLCDMKDNIYKNKNHIIDSYGFEAFEECEEEYFAECIGEQLFDIIPNYEGYIHTIVEFSLYKVFDKEVYVYNFKKKEWNHIAKLI